MRRLSFLVLVGLVAAAPQLAPMGGERTLVAMPVAAPKVIDVDVDVDVDAEAEPIVEDALEPPPAARACAGEALEVQPVGLRSDTGSEPAKQPPRLGLGTCN